VTSAPDADAPIVAAPDLAAPDLAAPDLGAPDVAAAARAAIDILIAAGMTIGTAESLTGGLVAAALTTIPGSSAVVRGGIVAYAADVKNSLLGVPSDLLDRVGTVHRDVALAMATGARNALAAAVGVATTGVAGPEPAGGQPVGTVHIAVSTPARAVHEALALSGGRSDIRQATVCRVLRLLARTVTEDIA
jgi:nicotinamide-nucleotide amidase